jgi:hypothetical protein
MQLWLEALTVREGRFAHRDRSDCHTRHKKWKMATIGAGSVDNSCDIPDYAMVVGIR